MPSLFASLGIGREALQTQQFALDVTQNNIANVNTAGYARQRVNLVPGEPTAQTGYQTGEGVRVGSIESYRQRFLDHRVNEELQRQGEFDASSLVLQQVEAIFNENAGTGLQSAMDAFFNSISSLANAPEDVTLRQQVLARAEDLGFQFKQSYEQLQSIQKLQDNAIAETVAEINQVAAAIADLNAEVVAARNTTGNEYSLRDQRQQLVDRLAGLVDISFFETETGAITITTRQGTLLVTGSDSVPWQAGTSSSGTFLAVRANGVDITSTIQSGKLAGLIDVRDTKIPSYLSALDDMAAAIIARVNAQHAAGSDLDGAPGGDFFVPFAPPVPGSNAGAARAVAVSIQDPARIAAAGAGSGPGSNVNARLMAGIQNEAILSGSTATVNQFYSNLIFHIGLDAKSAIDGVDTQRQLLTQIQNQRDSTTGVNLDEEATNIIRFQKAYQANARFISVIDELTEDVIRILGG